MKLLFFLLLVASTFFGVTVFATSENLEDINLESTRIEGKIEIKINQTTEYKDLKIKLTEINESRCPSDITCVWQGQVEVIFQINQNLESHRLALTTTDNTETNIGEYTIKLLDVSPYPTTTMDISNEYVVSISISKNNFKIIPAPLKQIKNGVLIEEIKCNEEKQIAYKNNLLRLACVSQTAFEKLVDRGWALSENEQNSLDVSSLSEDSFLQMQTNNSVFNISPKIINGQKLIIFEGTNWNLAHNLEITILDKDKITEIIKTRTSSNGEFYITWMVPSNFQSGQYEVRVSDGNHKKVEKVTISGISNEIRLIGTGFEVVVDGDTQVRRGTTHSIDVNVYRDNIPVQGARIFLTIEDYGEDIIREFEGRTDENGYFNYSWEIPKSFDDYKTLLAFVGVTDGNSSKTELFKFTVYCLPGEKGCKIDGN